MQRKAREKRFIRYTEGAEMYSMSLSKFQQLANDGFNCCINNLCFLIEDENKAKGMTVDKLSKEKSHIALSLYKDFSTGLIQISVFFNYPAITKIEGLKKPAMIDLAHLLYDVEYEMVLNDARTILYEYRRGKRPL